ncbi:MAG TPA: hypothetical protein VNT75_09010, partial [Symbiobacteriaceae bacterium]|nr:hypothetical protein [Symbiobacteriaceae bacterium]
SMPNHDELGGNGAPRSRIVMRIGFVDNPTEAKKAIDILSRGRQRALQKLLSDRASSIMNST